MVSGISFFEVDKIYQLPIIGHHSLVMPGEILPMIISESIFENDGSENLIFGLVFWENSEKVRTKETVFGVTCQVYEKGVDSFGHITLKSRAIQRFQVVPKDGNLTTTKHTDRGRKFYASVKILPEIILPDPIVSLCASNNTLKFLHNPSQYENIKNFITRSYGVWPKFVYDQYEIVTVMQKVERFLAMLNMTEKVPTDPVALSFWLARNIPLKQKERQTIFISNCVTTRMLIIGRSLNFSCRFVCKRCKNQISTYNDIFALSKNGVQQNYWYVQYSKIYNILDNF
jgi:cereblon